ncbi:MAG TPA: GFA family protein [Kofleriaceae bacterium]|jgi:hypothetical protein|nr:GFA family protein [Kofleriaceae bacterium]
MSNATTHTGGCHCGKVRFKVTGLDLSQPVITCNCSMCGRSGTMLAFVPAEQFELQSGEGVLTDYTFNRKIIHHLFCSVCGIKAFGRGTGPDGKATAAVNVRCLDDVDLDQLAVHKYDGRSH